MIIVITDGEPSDGNADALFRVLQTGLNQYASTYVSFTECNDNEKEMEYLDGWDSKLPRFDNTDDYGELLIIHFL